jgi:Rrf2 family transcriptional regulator, nitric oxide-sensitive transcriptional repressor
MNYQRSTRYALYAAVEMAAAPPGEPVTAAHVAARYRLPPTVVAKVIQRLVKAGIARGTRGVAGGYRLARPAAQIALLEVVELFEGPRAPSSCVLGECGDGECGQLAECRLHGLFDEIDDQARATFASVSLATLVAPRRPLVRVPLAIVGR